MSDLMDSGQETAAPVEGQFDLFTGAVATTTEWAVRYTVANDSEPRTSKPVESFDAAVRACSTMLLDKAAITATVVRREVEPWAVVEWDRVAQ